MNIPRTAVGLLVLGLLSVGCTAPTAEPQTAATQPPAVEAPTGAGPADAALAAARATGEALPRDPTAAEMADGRHMVRILAVEPGAQARLVVNPVVWFGGMDEANAASIADGHTTGMDQLPNGFYVRDLDPATVTLPMSAAATARMVSLSSEIGSRQVNPEALLGWFAGTPMPMPTDAQGNSLLLESRTPDELPPFWLTTEGGQVVAIEEQYIP